MIAETGEVPTFPDVVLTRVIVAFAFQSSCFVRVFAVVKNNLVRHSDA